MLNIFKKGCAHVMLKRQKDGETDVFEANIAPSRSDDGWIIYSEASRLFSGKRPNYSEQEFKSFEEAEKALRRRCEDRLGRGFVVDENAPKNEVA